MAAMPHPSHSIPSALLQRVSPSVSQVTFEAQGMESMMGENLSEGEEEPELMAGMSATFFDIQLRPITLFQGYTDLMAKVLLSRGGPTSVVKGNLLLMDHHQVLPGEEAVTRLHTTCQ